MPELPEVETTRRGLATVLPGLVIHDLVVREADLRERIPHALARTLRGRRIIRLSRRGKYLLVHLDHGGLLIHLGMSGSLRLEKAGGPYLPHDRWILALQDGRLELRLHDPRRFSLLRASAHPERDPLLSDLGPEPLLLTSEALAEHLHGKARGRKIPVKSFLMDGKVIAGIGNIYANEALFRARIRPTRKTGRLRRHEWQAIATALQRVLEDALASGGSSLRDYRTADGRPGHFHLHLDVYGREGEACHRCGRTVQRIRHAQRSSFYCPGCQR